MKLIPAIDIIDNKCVRLSKGREDSIQVYNTNPIDQAKYFEKEGCERIHVIDLDAAFGRGDVNKQTILDIRKSISIPIELGGGINNKNDIFYWFNNNIDFLIIGSLAIKDHDSVISISKDFENKIYVSLDQLNNKIMIKGWLKSQITALKKSLIFIIKVKLEDLFLLTFLEME